MDFAPIITIVVSLVVVFFFIKLVVSPLVKVIIGIAVFLIMIYLLQHFLNFDVSNSFGPFGKYLDLKNWNINFQEVINQIKNIFK